jgi:hypothetical protein
MEYFILINQTTSDIEVVYHLKEIDSGFPIFDVEPTLYETSQAGEIKWKEEIKYTDEDTTPLTVKLTMPPQTVLKFGHLSNEQYSSHDQESINSREFNLQVLVIQKRGQKIEIPPEQFDDYFAKEDNHIKYVVE